jgi:hypothetical protein
MAFPIYRQLPPGLHNPIGLTLPPRAGVLVPKTHNFLLPPVPISLVFAYGSEGQDSSSLPQDLLVQVAVPLPSADIKSGCIGIISRGTASISFVASAKVLGCRAPTAVIPM